MDLAVQIKVLIQGLLPNRIQIISSFFRSVSLPEKAVTSNKLHDRRRHFDIVEKPRSLQQRRVPTQHLRGELMKQPVLILVQSTLAELGWIHQRIAQDPTLHKTVKSLSD